MMPETSLGVGMGAGIKLHLLGAKLGDNSVSIEDIKFNSMENVKISLNKMHQH